ncbi:MULTISPECIES: MFS transporter [Mycobacterium avium complex (MAC)]|uniref:Putative proline/betaine transporter n=2 Tax=Mycobacterium avium complex (MAC) TaxID=120793 RepID=A0AAW5S2X5_MYCBC|nr:MULTISPECIES: MFS transporter [Mycobacterium avium complex (MAC)]EUA36775.1 sugar (and other) transporter family protein [Mycobacterium avium subsp. avium 2285 (R)]ABK68144.1 major facilitator superfamily protein [Mycobacterium avium 104]ETZ49672.1 sugar (and other) transporter family protein [Mycobacterium avium MAV_061107_1842]MBZ4501809.1 MHS family MFS transporter [Mycobacterium avium subsp. hominissuis]MBZ4503888.1 MHS family MFS transporter [Mycobacterium avium subsp. hominissuis]
MAATLPAPAPAGLADGHPLDESAEQQRRRLRIVVAASLLGTTVEWYDFFLYATAAGLVFNKVFFPNESSLVGTLLAFATFAVGFVMRPIGGLVFGHIGDRIGRKRSLALTMLIMGGATALIGVLPTAAQIGAWAPVLLLVLRVLQGFALGGEWGGAVLLAVEHSPGDRRGRYGAVPQVGLALGLALGTGIFAFLQIVLGPARFLSYGWRIGFLLSVLLVAIGIVVRLRVEETPAFRELQDLQAASTVPIRDILRERRSRRNTVLGLLSRWAEGSAFNTWGVFAISYATGALGLNRVSVLIAVTIAALLMAVLLPVSGVLTDRFGARRVYLAGIACYGLAAFPAFALFGTKKLLWFGLAMVIVFGVVHALFYGAQGTLYSALYPTNTRYTGLSFVYQFSGVYASGVTPMILTALIAALGGAPWLACGYLVATAVISVLATALIRDRDLYL